MDVGGHGDEPTAVDVEDNLGDLFVLFLEESREERGLLAEVEEGDG